MNNRAIAVLMMTALFFMQGIMGIGTPTSGGSTGFGSFELVEDPDPWTDTLDDVTCVYIPPNGLVGVKVEGGEVRLTSSVSEGWIASTIITCPPGNRYDLVVVDAELPGESTIKISVLDATEEASEVGYANETIAPLKDVEASAVSLRGLNPTTYPEIRIQVNLQASGDDRPVMRAWSVYYSGLDEWREDFVSQARMEDLRGLNLTDGRLELDLTHGTGPSGKAKASSGTPYPTLVFDHYDSTTTSVIDVFYANQELTGYDDRTYISAHGPRGLDMADFDGDGYLDVVTSNNVYDGASADSWIYWGQSDGTWTADDVTELGLKRGYKVAVGDVDGDGDVDLAFAAVHASSTASSAIYLNPGDGEFNYQPDIVFTDQEYHGVDVADLNIDGYDDVIFTTSSLAIAYFGGPSGPDKVADIEWTLSGYSYGVTAEDFDGDGYVDVCVLIPDDEDKIPVYMGSASGVDTTADYLFPMAENRRAYSFCQGDMNGDGYSEMVFMTFEGTSAFKLYVFEGTSSGWETSSPHKITITNYAYATRILDLDLDGYGDLVIGYQQTMRIYMGGTSLPTDPDVSMSGVYYPSTVVAATSGKTPTRKFSGRLVTKAINLPTGKNWDTLALEGTCPPNSSVSITLKDGNTNAILDGYEDIDAMDVDLTALGASSIKVELWLESDLNTSTPCLELLRVKWTEPNTWREQFYGPSKTARLMGAAVSDGRLVPRGGPSSPEMLFTGLVGPEGELGRTMALVDDGTLSYTEPPIDLSVSSASAVAAEDVDGNGYLDLLFARYRSAGSSYKTLSPLYMGTPVGWSSEPDHEFPTTGASDAIVEDLDGDGYMDVVFAQERDMDTYMVNSTLFWGSATGWSSKPDIEFSTTGAVDVAAADIDGDGDTDLAFACYKSSSTATESMVFLQEDGTFDGSSADHMLATKGARGVAAADLNGDCRVDLVFANSFSGGLAEIDSYIYWGAADGFSGTVTKLPTAGAEDVAIADLNGDGGLDIVFANNMDDSQSNAVDSFVYLKDGWSYPATPSARLPTVGAYAVTATDLDGTGHADLVFACLMDGEDPAVPSLVFLGGASGWSSQADLELPIVGASDVAVVDMIRDDAAGYLSKAITPANPDDTGAFHTLRYTAHLEGEQKGTIALVDADTWEVLTSKALEDGPNAWTVEDVFEFRDHPSVRVMITANDLDGAGAVWADDLWLNWTKRVRLPPQVASFSVEDAQIFRTRGTTVSIEVADEYTPPETMMPRVEHRLAGTETWSDEMLGDPTYADGVWKVTFHAGAKAQLGVYELRVNVTDSDHLHTGWVTDGQSVEVMNMLPTAPEVRVIPGRPVTTATLRVETVKAAIDPEDNTITYKYGWFLDGELVEGLTSDSVPPSYTSKGDNWSVEVRAFDGDDLGPVAISWRIIQNAAPMPCDPIPDPSLEEDTPDDEWICLAGAFTDPDGDPVAWSIASEPVHLTVTIDPETGRVTIVPDADWNGEESVTFVASDGELSTSQTVTVVVTPVNDAPRFVTVDGELIDTDTIEYTIGQDDVLVITPGVVDVEGHDLVFDVNSTVVEVDGVTGRVRFAPDNDAVGTLRFGLTVYDVVSPQVKVRLNIIIHVVNENDPMDDPQITSPVDGEEQRAGRTFSLACVCFDPDTPFGQELNYTWTSSIEDLIGYGATLIAALTVPGTHTITVTVTDGEFQKTATVTVTVLPEEVVDPDPPNPDPTDDDSRDQSTGTPTMGLVLALLVVVAGAGAGGYIVMARRRSEDEDAPSDEEPQIGEREALRQMAAMAKEAADTLEESKNGNGEGPRTEDIWVEEEVEGIAVASAHVAETQLTMKVEVTGEATSDVKKLWADIDQNGFHASEEDAEQLRLDNLKRKYHNTIGQLPYGIPVPELKDRDWNDLAAALAAGEKRTVEGDREVTSIDGRWYYSDMDDPASFLKEHGKKKGKASKGTANTDHEALLAKLEERFILGEISEQAYNELKQKYS